MTTKYLFAMVKEAEGDAGEDRPWDLEAVASTGGKDRDSEIIEPEAWRESLDGYRRNPVILATHQHRLMDGRSPVIGSSVQTDLADGQLVIRPKFAGTPLGQEYRQLYAERHMRAFSVGFIPIEGGMQERDLGGGKKKRLYVHTRVELLEVSAVPVPANPDALARSIALSAAGLDEQQLVKLAEAVAEKMGNREGDAGGLAVAFDAAVKAIQAHFDVRFDEIIASLPDTVNLPELRDVDPLAADAADTGGGDEDGVEDVIRQARKDIAQRLGKG